MNYLELISIENLFQAWSEFKKGKRGRVDVQRFERNLEDNLFDLHLELKSKSYKHGSYFDFYVHDPKIRHIHKAQVKDRVVHHLLYKFLYEIFDKSFIYDSYSCREKKGTHKAVKRLEKFSRTLSKNYTKECWGLKLDIKKFFASIDHKILLELIKQNIKDKNILWLLTEITSSFHSEQGISKGIPLGNLTSQIFANIYLSQLDQFIKHKLKIKYYLRYADDFIILADDKLLQKQLTKPIQNYLDANLKLELHPKKIILRKFSWGIDFLGYTVLPHYILPRTKTRRRIFKKLKSKIGEDNFHQSLQSYLGYLGYANSFKIRKEIIRVFF